MQVALTRLFIVLSLAIAGYAAFVYLYFPLGQLVHPKMKASFNSHAAITYTHIFGSLVALALGPFQFSPRLRRQRPALHRWCGRLYLSVGIFVGGLSGLYLAFHAFGGLLSKSGFATLALVWLGTGSIALYAILKGNVAAHRRWMIRSMALTFAAVTLRIYLGTFSAIGWKFENFYPYLGWLCWLPNLIIAEWLLVRRRRPTSGHVLTRATSMDRDRDRDRDSG